MREAFKAIGFVFLLSGVVLPLLLFWSGVSWCILFPRGEICGMWKSSIKPVNLPFFMDSEQQKVGIIIEWPASEVSPEYKRRYLNDGRKKRFLDVPDTTAKLPDGTVSPDGGI